MKTLESLLAEAVNLGIAVTISKRDTGSIVIGMSHGERPRMRRAEAAIEERSFAISERIFAHTFNRLLREFKESLGVDFKGPWI